MFSHFFINMRKRVEKKKKVQTSKRSTKFTYIEKYTEEKHKIEFLTHFFNR